MALRSMSLHFVKIRGGSYAIENPTEWDIRGINEFAQAPRNNHAVKSAIADAVSSMIPSLPHYIASYQEFEQPDGTVLRKTVFTLRSYELIGISQVAALAFCSILVEELKATTAKDKPEEAKIRNHIVRLEKQIAEDLSDPANALLMILDGVEIPTVLPENLPGSEPIKSAEASLQNSKPLGMGKPTKKQLAQVS